MATHLIEGFDSELILVGAVLIFCLGAAHAGRVAEVFGLVVPRVAQVHYHLHTAHKYYFMLKSNFQGFPSNTCVVPV